MSEPSDVKTHRRPPPPRRRQCEPAASILALRAGQRAGAAWPMDLARDLPRPRAVDAPWQWREVDVIPQVPGLAGVRHVVVHPACKARHDFEVRAGRLRRALEELERLRDPRGRLQQTRIASW